MTLDIAKLKSDKAELEQQLQVTQVNIVRLQGALAYITKTITDLEKEEGAGCLPPLKEK
jgi:chromosome segregation ATPase